MSTLAVSEFVVGLLVVMFVVVSIMMMLVVLIQRPQGGGLSEAFGASSGSNTTAFGAKTGDALTTATIVIFLLFIGFAIGLNYMVRPPREAAAQPPQAQGAGPATAPAPGVQVQTIDPATGEQAEPIKLEQIPAPAGADKLPPPAPAAGNDSSSFVVPESKPQEPATEPAPAEPTGEQPQR